MTRENKLALVVGFGLILFVGILISDHFSTARAQQSAELHLQPTDPLARTGYADPTLIEMQPGSTAAAGGTMLTSPTTANSRTSPPPARAEPTTLVLGGENPRIGPAPEAVESLDWIFHTVRDNETLTEIARHYYRDSSLTGELAAFNSIANPDSIRPGHRLRIPSDDQLVRGRRLAVAPRSADGTSTRKKSSSYVVRSGDTLSEIASEQLGSAKKWQTLYEMNRDVIPNPDRLLEGTRLKLP